MMRENIENNLSRIGQLVEIGRNEITPMMRARKYALITTAIIFVIGAITSIGGPVPMKYGFVTVDDFSWPWRMV